jgi:hypothetical protein
LGFSEFVVAGELSIQLVPRNLSGSYGVIASVQKREEDKMKTTLLVFLMASAILAQAQTPDTRLAPSCGPNEVKFNVKTTKNPHQVGQPESGKALVYFIEDNSEYDAHPRPTTRAGVDGEWVGAAQGNSYFYFSVDPGEHHLCASWQTWVGPGVDAAHKTAALHFTVEAGGVYYFRAKNICRLNYSSDSHPATRTRPMINLELLDNDEGQLLTNTYLLSTFQQKK